MLKLRAATAPDWGRWAATHLDAMLLDHAHCEKKAAGAAVNLLFRYPERPSLQQPLSSLAREELCHFEEVLRALDARGIGFARQRPSPYGGRLHRLVRQAEPDRLLDLLLVCGVIEARSCERLGLLADAVDDPELTTLYRGLLAAEARHHRIYTDLAAEVAPREEVRQRLDVVLDEEVAALRAAPELPRLHAGPAGA